jgi:hypothetical protein
LHNQLPEEVPTNNLISAPYETQKAPKKRGRRVKRKTDIGRTDIEKKKNRARREKNKRDNILNEIYTMTARRLSPDDQKRFKELYSTTRKLQRSDIEELNEIKLKLSISSDDIGTPQVAATDVERKHEENDNKYKERKRKIISTRISQARRNAEYNKLKQIDEELDELLSWKNNRNDNDHRGIIEQPPVQPDNQQQQLMPRRGIIFSTPPHWAQEAINMPANEQQTVAPTGQLFPFAE